MPSTLFQRFIDQLSENKNVQNFVTEFHKMSVEVAKRGQELNTFFNAEKEKTLGQAHTRYQQAIKTITQAQKEMDREVDKAIKMIRQSATKVEKNLNAYKKKAVAQKAKVEKLIKAKAKKTATKPRRTSKKARTSRAK